MNIMDVREVAPSFLKANVRFEVTIFRRLKSLRSSRGVSLIPPAIMAEHRARASHPGLESLGR
jgi:hypothetical protein